MKNNKGITLIALVVTIIVLLILAGVSIAMLTGENGILNRGQEASIQSSVTDAKEQVSLTVAEAITNWNAVKYGGTTDSTVSPAIEAGDTMDSYILKALKAAKTNIEKSGVTLTLPEAGPTSASTSVQVVVTSTKKTTEKRTATWNLNGDFSWDK